VQETVSDEARGDQKGNSRSLILVPVESMCAPFKPSKHKYYVFHKKITKKANRVIFCSQRMKSETNQNSGRG